ncbi:MAG: hypothetical protein L6Q57_01890 [Alphaproteobacteria bacterium]|nr:hypothetical protein [Alphaproteobacteria bacterium]
MSDLMLYKVRVTPVFFDASYNPVGTLDGDWEPNGNVPEIINGILNSQVFDIHGGQLVGDIKTDLQFCADFMINTTREGAIALKKLEGALKIEPQSP